MVVRYQCMSFIILGKRCFAGAVDGDDDYFFCQWLHSIMHEDGVFPRALSWCNIVTLFFVVAVS